jgi:hypothetical protein
MDQAQRGHHEARKTFKVLSPSSQERFITRVCTFRMIFRSLRMIRLGRRIVVDAGYIFCVSNGRSMMGSDSKVVISQVVVGPAASSALKEV